MGLTTHSCRRTRPPHHFRLNPNFHSPESQHHHDRTKGAPAIEAGAGGEAHFEDIDPSAWISFDGQAGALSVDGRLPTKVNGLTASRPQTRASLAASCVRDIGTVFDHCAAAVWCTLSVRVWRGCTSGFRSSHSAIHLRASCSQLPIPGPGQREGVLAGQASSGTIDSSRRIL